MAGGPKKSPADQHVSLRTRSHTGCGIQKKASLMRRRFLESAMENADDQQFMGVPAYLASGLSPISRSVIYRWLRDGTLPPRRNRRGGYLVIHDEVAEAARRAAQEPVDADPLAALSFDDRDAARAFVARAVAAAPKLGPEAMSRVAAALSVDLQRQAAAAPAEIAGAA